MEFYNYINSIFKNQIKEVKDDSYNNQLPIFIKENYKLSKYNILGLDFICMKVAEESNLKTYIKHFNLVKQNTNLDVIIVFDNLSLRERNYLIENRIDFVVIDLQIFILRLGMLLNEKVKHETLVNKEKFTPITQLIFSYIFLNTNLGEEFNVKKIEEDLKLNKMSLKRGLDSLVFHNLIVFIKEHGNSFVKRVLKKQDMLKQAENLLIVPIKKKYYIFKSDLKDEWNINLFSADSTLSKLSMLSSFEYDFFAISKEQDINIPLKFKIEKYYDDMIKVHVFKYDPYLLNDGKFIDFISMYSILKQSNDPRVIGELEELKEKYYE